jgi:hypothetical protein
MWCRECKTTVGTAIKADGKPDLIEYLNKELKGGWIATLRCGHLVIIPRGK